MREKFLLYALLAILSFWICTTKEARAQNAKSEIVLRDGTVKSAVPLEKIDPNWVFIKDDQGLDREKVSLICFADCKDATRDSFQKDLIILKNGQRRFGEITDLKATGDSYVMFSGTKIALRDILYIKFADPVYDSFEKAFREPEKVTHLILTDFDTNLKHLPDGFGKLVNLEVLQMACLERLEDLPESIGNLRKLEKIIIDNGNGCEMKLRSLPASIGRLERLRILNLWGAISSRAIFPKTLANLHNLEDLNLGRNGLTSVPVAVASLRNLKRLALDYNELRAVPAFISNLKKLRELSVMANNQIALPPSLATMKGLKIFMGNNALKRQDQQRLRKQFPNLVFDFTNDMDDSRENEEPPHPKAKQ